MRTSTFLPCMFLVVVFASCTQGTPGEETFTLHRKAFDESLQKLEAAYLESGGSCPLSFNRESELVQSSPKLWSLFSQVKELDHIGIEGGKERAFFFVMSPIKKKNLLVDQQLVYVFFHGGANEKIVQGFSYFYSNLTPLDSNWSWFYKETSLAY